MGETPQPYVICGSKDTLQVSYRKDLECDPIGLRAALAVLCVLLVLIAWRKPRT